METREEADQIIEEKFYRADYLGDYANFLIIEGWGTMRRRDKQEDKRYYKFPKHFMVPNVEVTIYQGLMGLWHARHYDVTLKGPKWQVDKFKDGAKRLLEGMVSSFECVKKQMIEKEKKETESD